MPKYKKELIVNNGERDTKNKVLGLANSPESSKPLCVAYATFSYYSQPSSIKQKAFADTSISIMWLVNFHLRRARRAVKRSMDVLCTIHFPPFSLYSEQRAH